METAHQLLSVLENPVLLSHVWHVKTDQVLFFVSRPVGELTRSANTHRHTHTPVNISIEHTTTKQFISEKSTFSTIIDVAPDLAWLDSKWKTSGGSVTAWSYRSIDPANCCYNQPVSEAGANFKIKAQSRWSGRRWKEVSQRVTGELSQTSSCRRGGEKGRGRVRMLAGSDVTETGSC